MIERYLKCVIPFIVSIIFWGFLKYIYKVENSALLKFCYVFFLFVFIYLYLFFKEMH